mgnify:CR=1 FL=1
MTTYAAVTLTSGAIAATWAGASTAVEAGAHYLGFVFFAGSPRAVTPDQAAALADVVPPGIARVGLFVNPDDATLDQVLSTAPLDMIQLHGTEQPGRVSAIRARTGLPVMKAVAISGPDDVTQGHAYADVADRLMFDAKPPKDATRPGGNALSFDWQLIAGESWSKPWILAGGLTPENVADAIAASGATAVDVSSGVEDASGAKNPENIRGFIAAAKGA